MDNAIHGSTRNQQQHRIPDRACGLRTDSNFHELLPLSYVRFLMATSTDRSISGYPPGPFPQRQRFPRSGAVAASRTHVTPPVGRLGAVTLLTSFHNGSNSRDSMPLRYRAKRKGLPDAAVARALRIPSAMAPNPGNQCHCGLSAIERY